MTWHESNGNLEGENWDSTCVWQLSTRVYYLAKPHHRGPHEAKNAWARKKVVCRHSIRSRCPTRTAKSIYRQSGSLKANMIPTHPSRCLIKSRGWASRYYCIKHFNNAHREYLDLTLACPSNQFSAMFARPTNNTFKHSREWKVSSQRHLFMTFIPSYFVINTPNAIHSM